METMEGSKSALSRTLVDELIPRRIGKGEQRKIDIAEAAIHLIATKGVEGTTFELIAKRCGISRPLVVHYFPERLELFEFAVKIIRMQFQELAVQAISRGRDAPGKLEAYVDSTFDWIERFPDHVRVWSVFFHYCAVHKKFRLINTELATIGHERIMALLEAGNKEKCFAAKGLPATAKAIQSVITGALVCLITEELPISHEILKLKTRAICLGLAKGIT